MLGQIFKTAGVISPLPPPSGIGLNIIRGWGGLQKISHGYQWWFGVQNISKYDIDIKEQPLREDLKKRVKRVTSYKKVGWVGPQKHISRWNE